jgi:hypothetical protein
MNSSATRGVRLVDVALHEITQPPETMTSQNHRTCGTLHCQHIVRYDK